MRTRVLCIPETPVFAGVTVDVEERKDLESDDASEKRAYVAVGEEFLCAAEAAFVVGDHHLYDPEVRKLEVCEKR